MSKTHELKTLPVYFEAVMSGAKPFEVRQDDREFQVGDTLVLREFDPTWMPHITTREPVGGQYTGRTLERTITYKLSGLEVYQFGVRDGFCVLGMAQNNLGIFFKSQQDRDRWFSFIQRNDSESLYPETAVDRSTIAAETIQDAVGDSTAEVVTSDAVVHQGGGTTITHGPSSAPTGPSELPGQRIEVYDVFESIRRLRNNSHRPGEAHLKGVEVNPATLEAIDQYLLERSVTLDLDNPRLFQDISLVENSDLPNGEVKPIYEALDWDKVKTQEEIIVPGNAGDA